jgi:hypothetical protein
VHVCGVVPSLSLLPHRRAVSPSKSPKRIEIPQSCMSLQYTLYLSSNMLVWIGLCYIRFLFSLVNISIFKFASFVCFDAFTLFCDRCLWLCNNEH